MSPRRRALMLFALSTALFGAECGGGSSSPAPTSGAPAAPEPSPSPGVPIPPPGSSPAPTVGGASTGETLRAGVSCATGTFNLAGGRPVAVTSLTGLSVRNGQAGNGLDIRYDAQDGYTIGLGFDDSFSVTPLDKRAQLIPGNDLFAASSYEFSINRQYASSTFGHLYTSTWGLCFYAGGIPTPLAANAGLAELIGSADGIIVAGGDDRRLYDSPVTATMNYATRALDVTLTLRSRDAPFGATQGEPQVSHGTVTARLNLPPASTYFEDAPLVGTGVSTGTITGVLVRDRAVALVFNLTFANGDRAVGALNAGPIGP